MGNHRPLPTKCWESLLKFLGYECDRISASHHQWTKTGKRTIPVWGAKKEIPAQFLRTNCRTFGWELDQVYAWASKHC